MLIGSAQHPAFTHPKILGQCYDNVYHQGCFIGDLPARCKNPTEAQTKKIYNKEYEEVIARIENSLNLSLQGMAYLIDSTSLLNPEIVLPPRAFQERCGLPEVPLGHMPQPQDYSFDGTQGLIDLSWEQWVPVIQQDDIDKNPLYTQYLYQEAGEYDDNEEEIEIDDQMLANARDARMAAPTSTQRPYHHLLASYATYTQQLRVCPRVSIRILMQLWSLTP